MSKKQTIATNIFMNGDDIAQVRSDIDQPTWEWGIDNALRNLIQVPPFRSSEPVLREIAQSGKKVLIRPAHAGEQDHAEPVKGIDSYDYLTEDWTNSTPEGSPPLACAEGSVEGRDRTGTPIFRRGDGPDPNRLGSGSGSDVCIYFTSQDHLKELSAPGGRPDEVLLHELVHSLRMALGRSLCLFMPDNYDTVEEFYAILVANIYRSECGYRTLRANHFGKTNLTDTDDGHFYTTFKDKIDSFVTQMSGLCRSIAAVRCSFNPIRLALAATGSQRR
ncbi:MAG TPA: hypothetical protein VGZ73_01480 [Bryobacteraceae bacterium]|nr:hypothetical protein [Bryobacteraceae bacterium]